MKPGKSILILPSCALKSMSLEGLIGRTAKVVEVVGQSDNIRGCWVELSSAYMDEKEWFIPISSIIL